MKLWQPVVRSAMGEAWFRAGHLCEFVDVSGEGFICQDWLDACTEPSQFRTIRDNQRLGPKRSTKTS